MNVVNYYLDRISSGLPGNFGYDFALKRLQVVNPVRPNECAGINTFRASICKFCKTPGNEDYLAVANEDGTVQIENTKHDRKVDVEFNAHRNAIFDMDWSECNSRLLLGSGDKRASLWDVRESEVSRIAIFSHHTQSVRSVAFRPNDKDVFATGGRDGLVIIWDARSPPDSAVVSTIMKPENVINKVTINLTRSKNRTPQQATFSICSLLFQDSVHLFCSSISESCVDVWDMRKIYTFMRKAPQPLYKLSHPDTASNNYYTSLCLNTSGTRLYANSKDGSIHSFNTASYSPKPESTYSGHEVLSTYIKCCLSPDDRYLVSGSTDGKAYMWNTAMPGAPIATINAHKTELSCVDWSRSADIKIATCSEDYYYSSNSEEEESEFTDLIMLWKVVTRDHDDDDDVSKKESKETADKPGTISWRAPAPIKRTFSRIYRACRPVVNKQPRINELNSPTVNLPNHVIDGTSPLHRCSPSSRKEKENRNWLSSLKKKTPSSLNSKSVHIKKGNSGQKPKACGNLLKFFKTSNKDGALESLTEVSNFCKVSTKDGALGLTEVSNFSEPSLMSGVMEI